MVYLSVMRSMRIAFFAIFLAAISTACSGGSAGTTPTAGLTAPAIENTAAAPTPADTPQASTPLPDTGNEQATPETPTETAAPTASTEIASASSLPDPQGYAWQLAAEGLEAPVGLKSAGDGSGRLFVLEQSGVIRILQDGAGLPAPFLDIRDRVGSSGLEQGLLGLAFHPNYTENGYFYVNYTDRSGDTVIARFQVTSEDPNRADPGSETILIQVNQPYANHNGGVVTFGPDGYLYIGLGDGGAGGDPHNNGQSLDTLLGKILRIDVDGGEPYAIPPDNPFVDGSGRPEIWAYGLRNPWRITFDRATGDLYIADVGQNQWEEINFLPAGHRGGDNFGWVYFEGSHPFQGNAPEGQGLVMPVAEYNHSQGCSVTGGVVYRGGSLPAWQGVYIYGDFCSGRVWGLLRGRDGTWQEAVLFENAGRITDFGQDEAGEVYLVSHRGEIYVLVER